MKFYTYYHHLIPSVSQNHSVSYIIHKYCIYVLSLVLAVSGIAKLVDSSGLLATLQQVSFLNNELIVLVATLLPIIELGLAAALLLQWKPIITIAITTSLCTGFLGFAIYGFYAGFTGDCGCFGGLAQSGFGWGMILRNGILLSLSVAALVACNKQRLRKRD